MTVIALCSLKGSPGVTTAALALAARWPADGSPVVVECDPAGGDLLGRFRLQTAPGLVTMAAAARRSQSADWLREHAQHLPGGLSVVAGPPGAEQARAALAELTTERGAPIRRAAEPASTILLADCGRADPESPSLPLLRTADLVVLLTQARDDALSHLATKLSLLGRSSEQLCHVLVGDGYSTGEVARTLRIGVLGRLPYDRKGAAVLAGQPGSRTTVRRSRLGRAAWRLAQQIAVRIATEPATESLTPAELAMRQAAGVLRGRTSMPLLPGGPR